MNFYSQSWQDRFVYELLVKPGIVPRGTFLDIGCAGLEISNTLGLEEEGYRGWLVDNSEEARAVSEKRTVPFLLGDATSMSFKFLPPLVDYLSLDVDFASLDALANLMLHDIQFRVVTIEHDVYRFPKERKERMQSILRAHGYDLICEDVTHKGLPFEDWWVMPSLVDMTIADKFRCKGKTAEEIFE